MQIIILGKPIGKQRPRMGRSSVYTPKETASYETFVKWCFANAKDKKMHEGEIMAEIKAYYPIPKSTSIKKQKLMLEEKIRPTKKPDCDNVAKIILDSLNGLAYKDDSQVVSLVINKFYSNEPRVEVYIEEIR